MSNYSKEQIAKFDKHYEKICDIKKKIDKGTYLKLNPAGRTDLLVKIIEDVCEYYLKVPGDVGDNHKIDVRKILEELVQVQKNYNELSCDKEIKRFKK